jgi:cysteinyl-tRNA synthetase
VYDYAHIGNFRAFLTYDVLKRWLQYCGYEVEHVCNLTDVDDKIIVKMAAEGKTLKEVTEKYTAAFFEDLDVLNIQRAQKYPKATEHIKDIVEMIKSLKDKGFAYEENGSVYFRVSAFEDYGRLANLKFEEMQEGAGGFGPNERRGAAEKESARDFALWKAFTEQDGEVVWDSVFGRGRPGWHIECSAMCNCLLGSTIDLHAGGVDLVFPHHSNEIAQSEAYSGEQFCRFWIHNGFVNVNNEKMSKSLKNFKTLRDLASSPFDARALRFLVVTAQYRNPLNLTPETIKAAAKSLQRIDKLVALLEKQKGGLADTAVDAAAADLTRTAEDAVASFEEAMRDDMNTPRATAALFGLVGAAEKGLKSGAENAAGAKAVLEAIRRMDRVMGVLYEVPQGYFKGSAAASAPSTSGEPLDLDSLPQEVLVLARSRAELKAQKKYNEADAARASLTAMGYLVKDKAGGSFDVFKL